VIFLFKVYFLSAKRIAAAAAALILCVTAVVSFATGRKTAKLAVILDDFGQARSGIDEIMSYEEPITFAVMPLLEYSTEDAENALKNGHEVIIHIPLQSQRNDIASWVGPYVININFTKDEIIKRIDDFCKSMPQAKGANIHMGALGSTDEKVVYAMLSRLNQKNMFFIDSKTHPQSVCEKIAAEIGIPFYENDIFLEIDGHTKEAVKKRLLRAAEIARKTGECMAIGHVGAEGGINTIEAIKEATPEIKKMNVEFVYASELVK
jgi:polysaccharide deacetylase 2 family uncharacterized protein YibQ